jgi:hypothetical protein
MDKRSSLLRKFVTHGHKMFYNIGPRAVESEISDCKDGSTVAEFSNLCQNLLRASHGMNFVDFLELVDVVATKRIQFLTSDVTGSASDVIFDGWKLGRLHAEYDLSRIKNQLEILSSNVDLKFLSSKVEHILEKISVVF